jgi:RNA polymerase sigma-70 factor (ECF subfamily)
MERHITRAKARMTQTKIAFATPSAIARAERLSAAAAAIYLVFDEG